MNLEIISHDEASAKARLKFTHNGVVHEDNYDLSLVVPGTTRIFAELNMEFTKEHQLKEIEKLKNLIHNQIESGALLNRPE